MFNIKTALAASALIATLGISTAAPAKADGAASTRNILLGAAALVTGIAIEHNVANKNARANSIAGYTQDGGTVYGDGSVVYSDGQKYYPGNNGQQVSCNGESCVVTNDGNGGYYGNAGNGGNGNYRNGGNGYRDGGNGYYGNDARRDPRDNRR